jgi:hypothetical protein
MLVLWADFGRGAPARQIRGLEKVASQAEMYSRLGLDLRPALINGAVGVVALRDGRPLSIGGFTVRGGKIVEMDWLSDPERFSRFDLSSL